MGYNISNVSLGEARLHEEGGVGQGVWDKMGLVGAGPGAWE